MSPKKKQTGPSAYQVKLTVRDIDPPIWRRLLVWGEDTLADLHDAIQVCFGWDNCHLHEFNIGKKQYGTQDEDCPPEVLDDEAYTLDQILKGKKAKFEYVYDFGDNWTLELAVEDVQPLDPDQAYPLCVDGSRHGPAEDSGGPGGYVSKLEILQDPEHPDHELIAEWMGEDWDAEYFDMNEINAALHEEPNTDAIDFDNLSEEERDEILESMLDEDPFLEERVARMHDRIATAHGLTTPDAVHEFIEAMAPEDLRAFAMKHMEENPEDAAFEYGLLALEMEDPQQASELADKALELDPNSVDARIAKSNLSMSIGDRERGLEMLQEALDVARRVLGDAFFTENRGQFGEFVATRPYLRARFLMGHSLHEMDRTEEAATHYSEMLAEDPEDPMGVRYALAGALLELDRLEEARALIAEYNSDEDLILPWAHVLEHFLSGETVEAESALDHAISANPLMAASLLEPESANDLDLETDLGVAATMALAAVGKAWAGREDALAWLNSRVYGNGD